MQSQHSASLSVRSSMIKGAGNGLFWDGNYDIMKGDLFGRFGGQVECGLCVRQQRKNTVKNGYSVMPVDIEYGVFHDIWWHLTRTGDPLIDGNLWFMNSANIYDRNPLFRTPNVEVISSGFDLDGDPVGELRALRVIHRGEEILGNYLFKKK